MRRKYEINLCADRLRSINNIPTGICLGVNISIVWLSRKHNTGNKLPVYD